MEEAKFFSEASYEMLTGEEITVEPGQYFAIAKSDETALYYLNAGCSKLTNMSTFQSIPVSFAGYAHYDMLVDSMGYYVMSNEDYERIEQGLTPEWMGTCAVFNMDGEDGYAFAQDFFYTLVDSFGPECETPIYYDRVRKYYVEQLGEVYWGDTDRMTKISFSRPDDSDFRLYWTYMPKIRILDKADFINTFSVYLMMFLFIAIICSLAAMIISYTRCMTIALNNRYVFDDLKRLGASPDFLMKEIKGQAGPVFRIPSIVGMCAMYLLYALLMIGNDGKLTGGEVGGLGVCFLILGGLAFVYYQVYRQTLRSMCTQLGVA
ncbi:MAG: hypothetical protein K2N55_07655 [Lachnospiraceae bacterium]|nr:hypothetical protein [Lachnospiraceae bacterium]